MKHLLISIALAGTAALSFAQPTATAVTARCGGVGVDEQAAIKAEAARHGLLLSFAAPGGAYIADVDVSISNGHNTVLQTHCSGPLLLVDLAGHGTYQVTATANGQTQHKNIALAGKPASMLFTWAAS